MIEDMESYEKLSPIVAEFFFREGTLNISLFYLKI